MIYLDDECADLYCPCTVTLHGSVIVDFENTTVKKNYSTASTSFNLFSGPMSNSCCSRASDSAIMYVPFAYHKLFITIVTMPPISTPTPYNRDYT